MPRKLKTYETSIGFYDLAVAAPSMKAALEAWGADSNLFHQGAAVEVDDPAVVAATLAKPGVVLKRPVGSNGKFGEHSALPKFTAGQSSRKPAAKKPAHAPKIDDATQRKAALKFEREEKRRESERRRENAARAKARERRENAVAKAQAAYEAAERDHNERVAALEEERDGIEKRLSAEADDWEKHKAKFKKSLQEARG